MTTAAPYVTLLKPLSPQEWETLIDDYKEGIVLDCCKLFCSRDFSLNLKIHLLGFLEEYGSTLFTSTSSLSHLLDTLRVVIQSANPSDGVLLSSFKEQFLISTTSVYVAADGKSLSFETPEALVELLLTIIDQPNHGLDCQTRAIACECLQQLELAFPCILSEIWDPLSGLCQSERTHAALVYVLLFAAVVCNMVQLRANNASSTLTNASTPLIPFNIPKYLSINEEGKSNVIDISDGDNTIHTSWKDADMFGYKELRRIISFLLEWPQYLTSFWSFRVYGDDNACSEGPRAVAIIIESTIFGPALYI